MHFDNLSFDGTMSKLETDYPAGIVSENLFLIDCPSSLEMVLLEGDSDSFDTLVTDSKLLLEQDTDCCEAISLLL